MRDVPHLVAILTGYWYWRVGRGGDDVDYEDVEWWEVTFCADLGDWREVNDGLKGSRCDLLASAPPALSLLTTKA
jgi:hypothetical protein